MFGCVCQPKINEYDDACTSFSQNHPLAGNKRATYLVKTAVYIKHVRLKCGGYTMHIP